VRSLVKKRTKSSVRREKTKNGTRTAKAYSEIHIVGRNCYRGGTQQEIMTSATSRERSREEAKR